MKTEIIPEEINLKLIKEIDNSNRAVTEAFAQYNNKLIEIPHHWKGSDCKNALNILTVHYHNLKTSLEKFVLALNTDCSDIITRVNQTLISNGGEGNLKLPSIEALNINNIETPSCDTTMVRAREEELDGIINDIQTHASAIFSYKDSVEKIFGAIGKGSDFFDCNAAEELKTIVISVIRRFEEDVKEQANSFKEDIKVIISNYKNSSACFRRYVHDIWQWQEHPRYHPA